MIGLTTLVTLADEKSIVEIEEIVLYFVWNELFEVESESHIESMMILSDDGFDEISVKG